jgi:AraC family transcriptional regulator, arabinose operon regulatory protein
MELYFCKIAYLKITPNTLHIIPPDTPHHYQAIKKDPWSIYWLHFRGSYALHIYQKFCVKRVPMVKKVAFEERRVMFFDNIIDVLEKGYSADHLDTSTLVCGSCSHLFYMKNILPKSEIHKRKAM